MRFFVTENPHLCLRPMWITNACIFLLAQRVTSPFSPVQTPQKCPCITTPASGHLWFIHHNQHYCNMKGGYMYILKCANGQYYTGSTTNLVLRLAQHQRGEGANFTRKHLPVELVYYEEFDRIHKAYNRERQIHKWSHQKKEALIEGRCYFPIQEIT